MKDGDGNIASGEAVSRFNVRDDAMGLEPGAGSNSSQDKEFACDSKCSKCVSDLRTTGTKLRE